MKLGQLEIRVIRNLSYVVIYLSGLTYLLLPSSAPQPLPGATKSTEPGDTWQNPDQAAYFTQKDRSEVLTFYQQSFAPSLFGIKLPNYRLNYRPEDTAVYVRKYIDSYYLEEIINPMRESLFVNGWTPSKSPLLDQYTDEFRKTYTIVVDGQTYSSKITIKPYYGGRFAAAIIWTILLPTTYFALKLFFSSLKYLRSSL